MALVFTGVALLLVLLLLGFIVKRLVMFFVQRMAAQAPLHDDFADLAEDVAGATRIAAVLGTAVAYFAAPGLLVGLASLLGFIPVPLIARVAPVLVAAAAGTIAISAAAKLWAKRQRARLGKST